MTSLAQQLKRLALPQSDPNLLTRREVASLLFDPKDAASMDRSTFYALGCTGLEELLGIEPAFLEFQDTLFSRASLTLERSVQSKEVNEKLDAGVSLFLARLCPYFLLKPAHKCIEWLLHRFHIQLYNSESLLACALPYHDTNVFVRVVQLLRIKDATNRWNWLQGLQKPGVPLSRGTLITHCHSDLSFMDFICSLVTKSIQAYAGHSGSCSQLRVIFSFYASTIVAALDAVDAVSDTIIAKLLPYVNKGLKSALTDYKAATYMIVCQLAVKVVMEASLVDTLAAHVAKSLLRAPVLAREGVGCLTVLLQNQKEGAAGPRAFERLGSMPALASTLQAMAVAHDVTPLLRYLLPHLIHAAFTCSSGENGNHRLVHTTDSDMEIVFIQQYVLKRSFYYLLFFTCLALLLDEYLSQTQLSADDMSASDRRLLPLVRLLEARYCAALDAVLAAHVSSSEQKHLFHRFLSLSTSSGKYQVFDGVIFRFLGAFFNLFSPKISAPSLRFLLQQSLDESFLKDAVLERLRDDVLEVVAVLLDVLDPEDAVSSLLSLLHRVDLSADEQWLPVLKEAVRLLSDPRLGKGDVDLLQRTGWSLLPFLAITSVSQLRLAACIAKSSVIAQHPLTQNWAQGKQAEPVPCREFSQSASTKSSVVALEQLCVSVEQQQRGEGLTARVSFLVLTRSLLLGLGQLSETQHLLTAQRVYTLLETPLLDAIRDATATADAWWNPEKLDTNTCCYLGLTCRLFSLIMSGAAEGPVAASFRDLMKLLIQVHLPEPAMLFRFLCLLWGYGSNHGDQLDVKVGAVLQTQALYMGGALLNATPPALMQELLAAHSPVFPSLLCCLTSPLREVRRAGLAALQSLSAAGASPFQPITERLLKTSEEILADPSYLSQALGGLHDDVVSARVKSQQQKKLEASLHLLLQSVQTPCCPSYSAGGLLRALSLVNGPSVLSRLLPVLDRLLEQSGPDAPSLLRAEAQLVQLILGKFSEASAPLLAEDHNCLDLFVRALRSSAQPHADIPSCQITALEQMTKPLFSALGDTAAVQQKLLAVMFDVLVESRSPLVANTVSSAFKGIAVDAQLVANELAPPEKPKVSVTVQQSRRSRMTQRFTHGGAVPWRRVTLILELLQHKKKLQRAQTLVPALFSLLARSLEVCPGDHTNMEYTKQLLLSCLLNVLHKLSPDGSAVATDVLDEEKFSVELVVQVIRASDMPQTHHHALLLLGAAAAIFPEKVLHNIMPIFTFMGANIMRLDDAYSFRVIDRTVQMVIPALIQQLSDGSASSPLVAVVTRIMHVFADALPHVPEHRRLPILRQLVTTLGPAHFLWVLMLLLFKLHATQSAAQSADEALEKDVDFWISLCCEFSVNDQLTSIINILNFLLQLPDDSDDAPKRKKSPEEEVLDLIFSPEAHSSKELRHFKFLSVCFMAQLLGSSSFIGKVRQTARQTARRTDRQPDAQLLEEILRYVHSVARCVENSADKPTAKFWRVLLNKTYDVLDKVNSLLPTDTFITVMRGLMGNDLPSVRRKAMELLNNKLTQRTPWDDSQVSVLLQLTDDLLSIVGKRGGADAEPAINRQTALYSLKLLCRGVGSQRRDAFGPVLLRAVDIVAAGDEDRNVTGSALLCVAELVGTLKALAIPQLPRLMPAVLQALTDRKELLTNEIYLLSAVTALQRVTETLPHFISPYLDDVTQQVCRLTRFVASPSPSSAASQLAVRLASLRSTLATALPPRVLLPTVARCYSSMVLDRKEQLAALLGVLKQHIGQMEKEPLSFHQSELTSFFLSALDFRAQHCQGDLKKTAEIEGCVIDCLIAMVMKLSEVTFRPLFFKLLDWSKSGSTERLLTFYRLSDFIAERLKGLFVLFAGNLVKPFADLLRQTNGSQTDALLFESCGEEKVSLLLSFVLDCLQKIFLFDTQRFLSRERADALLTPLVDQLENSVGGQQAYEQRVTQHLVPCVGQFSVALADDALWKTLNYQILLKTRHADSKVRFSALVMLMELASKLKENYMVLLPETIPFLAELMEDECEEVEQQVQKVVQEMENILGEPLQSYF
uniref:HEAT repeat-containing protein 1 n=1 Tax=Sander lucioperca TaxID=283035 RepID=A0A8C9X9E9_SANLU